ncbi:hypothetical protein RFI_11535 [Reticulomyxa filosa]|uniref:Protein kinase domain-containing protein n=1 Tax=Reticulomyxa filosa TaxID=46433 RepID=X6NJR8_RETFI|nr:hypothetical protein RFI_11535 [Reticulomyxa filosa]|eukprot:ETO25602.1 hypothetical protein RFI_11535 [Reticulomyxa filosa]
MDILKTLGINGYVPFCLNPKRGPLLEKNLVGNYKEDFFKENGGSKKKKNKQTKKKTYMYMHTHKLERPIQLFHTSPVSKMSIYEVESVNSGEKYLMKSIKNESCVALQLRYELDRLKLLKHPILPKLAFIDYGDAYSYIIFEK